MNSITSILHGVGTTLLAVAAATLLAIPATAQTAGGYSDSVPDKTIVEVASSADGFATLVEAVKAAGLAETLASDGPFTVFAPTDEAFAALPEGTLESLLEDRDALKAILTYHVVSGKVTADEVVGLNEAETVNGAALRIRTADGGVMVNDARVLKTDIQASNGVIHVIDAVLLPPSN